MHGPPSRSRPTTRYSTQWQRRGEKRSRRRCFPPCYLTCTCRPLAPLQLRLEAEEQPASAVVVGERLVLELQVGVLFLVGHIHRLQHQAEVSAKIVAHLRVELSVGRLVDGIGLRIA